MKRILKITLLNKTHIKIIENSTQNIKMCYNIVNMEYQSVNVSKQTYVYLKNKKFIKNNNISKSLITELKNAETNINKLNEKLNTKSRQFSKALSILSNLNYGCFVCPACDDLQYIDDYIVRCNECGDRICKHCCNKEMLYVCTICEELNEDDC